MKTLWRRITALVLALSMCLSLLSVNVWAAETAEDGSVSTQSAQEAAESAPAEDTAEESGAENEEGEAPETPAEDSGAENEEAEAPETPAEESGAENEEAEAAEAPKAGEDTQKSPQKSGNEDEKLTTQSVILLANFVERIEVQDITRFDFDRFDCHWDGDHEVEEPWSKLDCWPGGDNMTVVLTDGTRFRLEDYERDDEEDPMQAMSNAIVDYVNDNWGTHIEKDTVHLGWDSDEQSNDPWGVGEYEAKITLWRDTGEQGPEDYCEQTYNVKVVKLSNISVQDITRSADNRVRDENNPEDKRWNGKVECWPDEIQVTIDEGNGVKKTFPEEDEFCNIDDLRGQLWDEYPNLRHLDFDWRTEEDPDNPWGVGEYPAKFFLWGYYDWDSDEGLWGDYYVTVTESPFDTEGCHVDDIKRYAEDRNREGYLNCDPDSDNSVTVKLAGGEVLTGSRDKVQRILRDDYGMDVDLDWRTDEDPEKPWGEGEHKARLVACLHDEGGWNYEVELCSYKVTVLALGLTVTKVEVGDKITWSNNRDEEWEWDEEAHEDVLWYSYDTTPDYVKISVKNAAGAEQTFEGSFWDVHGQLDDYLWDAGVFGRFPMDWFGYSAQERTPGHWQVGHTYPENTENPELSAVLIVNGERYYYNTTVMDHPVAGVEVTKPVVRLSTDRHMMYDCDANDNNYTWQRVDCWPEEIKLTLKKGFVDGNGQNSFIGDPDDAVNWLRNNFGFDTEFYWDSTETANTAAQKDGNGDYPGSWGSGKHEKGAWVYLRDFEEEIRQFYDVTVVDNPIVDVHVDDQEIYESYCNKREYWVDDERFEFDCLDCHPEKITVTLNGDYGNQSRTADSDTIENWLRETLRSDYPNLRINSYWESEQEEDHKPIQVKANFTTAKFNVCGVWSNQYNVTVKESPLATLTVEPVTVTDANRETVDWEDREDWERYDCWPNRITVTLKDKDGSTRTGYPWEVNNWVEIQTGFDASRGDGIWWESQEHPAEDGRPANFWVVGDEVPDKGKTYENGATFYFGGKEASYDVIVARPLSVKIQVNSDIYRLTTDRNQEWRDGCGYWRIDCWPENIFTVTVNNKTYTGKHLDEIEEDLRERFPQYRIECNWESDEGPNMEAEPDDEELYPGTWDVGDHTARVNIAGTEAEYTVHVVDIDDIIQSVEIPDLTLALTDRRVVDWRGRNDEVRFWNRLECYPNQVKITLKGNEHVVLPGEGWSNLDDVGGQLENYLRDNGCPGIRVYTNWYSDEEPNFKAEPVNNVYPGTVTNKGTIAAKADIGGFVQSYKVHVTESPIKSVSVEPITRTETDRQWQWRWEIDDSAYIIDTWPDSKITVTFADNSTVSGYLYASDEDPENLEKQVHAKLESLGKGNLELHTECDSHEPSERNAEGGYIGTWKAGDKGTANFSICGVECTFDVNVIRNPVTAVEVTPQVIPATKTVNWNGETYLDCTPISGTVKVWLNDEAEPSIAFNVADLDGNAIDHLRDVLYEKLSGTLGRRVNVDWDSDQEGNQPWNQDENHGFIFCFGERFPFEVTVSSVQGDIDGDGAVTMADVVRGNQIVVGLIETTGEQRALYDVTGDGDYTMTDVVWTNSRVLGRNSAD